ncbi:MAG: GNAT family N-acetyltransferase [Microcoleaceae cyanobacterium]
MKSLTTVQIETVRLVLKPITLDYAAGIFREFTPEITRFLRSKPCETLEQTKNLIRNFIQQREIGTDLHLVILKKDDLKKESLQKDNLEFIGMTGCHQLETQVFGLGIWLKKSAHGQGFGREAIHGLKTWIDQNLDYLYLVYPVDQHNIPSRKIPESLGGKIFKNYRELNQTGYILNLLEYRIYPRK